MNLLVLWGLTIHQKIQKYIFKGCYKPFCYSGFVFSSPFSFVCLVFSCLTIHSLRLLLLAWLLFCLPFSSYVNLSHEYIHANIIRENLIRKGTMLSVFHCKHSLLPIPSHPSFPRGENQKVYKIQKKCRNERESV